MTAAQGPMLLEAACWCEANTVMVPVSWISEALTGSCGPNCGPGCPIQSVDAFEDDAESVTRKKVKMKRFDASHYDPRADSSLGYARSETRELNPDDLVLEVIGDGREDGALRLCACGCGEVPKGKTAQFAMGHDARLRGKLARAYAAQARVVLTDQSHITHEILAADEYAARFNTDKLDWANAVRESAARAKGAPTADETDRAIIERALAPQVGDTRLIHVGRWEKTGRVLAVYEDGSGILYEYTDGDGKLRRARQDADGIHEVQEAS